MFWLKIVQLIIAIGLILSILLQNRGGGLSGVFGGGGGNVFMAKRGLDKMLFISTIVLAIIFFLLALVIILL